jgi:hypothetical protein
MENYLFDVDTHLGICRVFTDEQELVLYIDEILSTCRKMVSEKIETHLRKFLDNKDSANIFNADLTKAGELLAFVSAEDNESIVSVLSNMRGLTMPVNGIANTLSKLLAAEAPGFFEVIRYVFVPKPYFTMWLRCP